MALNILIYAKHREVINRVVQSFLSKLAVLKYKLSLHRDNSYNTNTQADKHIYRISRVQRYELRYASMHNKHT